LFLGELVEKLVNGDAGMFLPGACGGGAVDDDLGGNLLHDLGLFVDLGLRDLACGFAAGLAQGVDPQ